MHVFINIVKETLIAWWGGSHNFFLIYNHCKKVNLNLWQAAMMLCFWSLKVTKAAPHMSAQVTVVKAVNCEPETKAKVEETSILKSRSHP